MYPLHVCTNEVIFVFKNQVLHGLICVLPVTQAARVIVTLQLILMTGVRRSLHACAAGVQQPEKLPC